MSLGKIKIIYPMVTKKRKEGKKEQVMWHESYATRDNSQFG